MRIVENWVSATTIKCTMSINVGAEVVILVMVKLAIENQVEQLLESISFWYDIFSRRVLQYCQQLPSRRFMRL